MADFKAAFEGKLKDTFSSKNWNSVIPSEVKRNAYISRLLNFEKNGPTCNDDYNTRKRFEVLRVSNEDRLIKKRKNNETYFRFVIAFEEVYDALKVAHAAVGHGGEKKNSKMLL